MQDRLLTLKEEAAQAIAKSDQLDTLNDLRVKYLGKKGEITVLLKGLGSLSAEERPAVGEIANQVRNCLGDLLSTRATQLAKEALAKQLESEQLDVTVPGYAPATGSLHPLTLVIKQVEDIFIGLGFEIVSGSEVELDYYNFEALNIPADHPARDMQDTFYIDDEVLLRTHTSAVQLRVLEHLAKQEQKSPVRVLCPGKVYRRDADDATHSHQFTQIEALVVDKNASMQELKFVLTTVINRVFDSRFEMRFRPSFFPFTEPSIEVDILHPKRGWLEILGAGMVHPKVLERVGYDSDQYTGFAMGMGVERIAMLKYDIEDIRHFYNNDVRFLRQFN